jgi:ATP-dependent DNA helicase RecQ
MTTKDYAESLLHKMLGPNVSFRPNQWEAIEGLVFQKQRLLLVQPTGWGKSIVYFLATKLLREQGHGPTLLISPLLSLMRNQIEMAKKIGIRAATINSENYGEWHEVELDLQQDNVDILFISPERLNNQRFLNYTLPEFNASVGMLVVDEVHCISDWGHDFRPDYLRIAQIIKLLPKNIPVLGTTATANNRVVEDVVNQLGPNLTIIRGPLMRHSLKLQNLSLPDPSLRLAWLAKNLHGLTRFGSGIIYCQTVRDAERVADWLKSKGFNANAYHADLGQEQRETLEKDFLQNRISILVATIALGMGFDKPDVRFIIHYQRPRSVVEYYQQVGRAGRDGCDAYGILLSGDEEDDIHTYFIENAFPKQAVFEAIIDALDNVDSLTIGKLQARVNASQRVLAQALRLLELEGAIDRSENTYYRTFAPWQPNTERIERVLAIKRQEVEQMKAYLAHSGCLMEFLLKALDDPTAAPCGQCANCQQKGFLAEVPPQLFDEARQFLQNYPIPIEPRKRFPAGVLKDSFSPIPFNLQAERGRCLCHYNDGTFGKAVYQGKYESGRFSDELVDAAAQFIYKTWGIRNEITWVTAIPSLRHPQLVPEFAQQLAKKLNLPFLMVLRKTHPTPEQKTMQNNTMQALNVIESLKLDNSKKVPSGAVLLVDDIYDSGWTLTIAAYFLRKAGSGPVYPFAIAKASTRGG